MYVLVSWRQVAGRLETSLEQVIQGFAARFSLWRRRKGSNHPLPPPPPQLGHNEPASYAGLRQGKKKY